MRILVLRIVPLILRGWWAFREKSTKQSIDLTDHVYCLPIVIFKSHLCWPYPLPPKLLSFFFFFFSILKDRLKLCSSPNTCSVYTDQTQASMNSLSSRKKAFLFSFLCAHPFLFPPFFVGDSFLHFSFSLLYFIPKRWLNLLKKNFLSIYFLLNLPSSFNFTSELH